MEGGAKLGKKKKAKSSLSKVLRRTDGDVNEEEVKKVENNQ